VAGGQREYRGDKLFERCAEPGDLSAGTAPTPSAPVTVHVITVTVAAASFCDTLGVTERTLIGSSLWTRRPAYTVSPTASGKPTELPASWTALGVNTQNAAPANTAVRAARAASTVRRAPEPRLGRRSVPRSGSGAAGTVSVMGPPGHWLLARA
jgi:hypothetical protein